MVSGGPGSALLVDMVRPFAVVALILAGCSGLIAEPGPEGESIVNRPPPEALCNEIGEQPLRRISSEQYDNVLRDLFPGDLGTALVGMSTFPETTIDDGFINDAQANLVNTFESNTIEDNAETLATHFLDNASSVMPEVLPCGGYSGAEVDGCIDAFIDEFGLRAFRRPVTDGERGIIRGIYDRIRAAQGVNEAFASVMQYFLQAPALLYRVEQGRGTRGIVELTDYEMASRLSFMFLNSMPDEELFAAAAAGQLSTRADIEVQARRLANDPRAVLALETFQRDWMRLHHLEVAPPDDPRFNGEVATAMLNEPSALLASVMNAGGTYQELMTTSTLPVNGALAELYGVDLGGAGPDEWVETAVGERHGLLTQAGVLAAHSSLMTTNNPIHRGAFVRREILCGAIPPFPNNVDVSTPLEATAGEPTARDRLRPTIENAQCRSCHSMINEIGYAFEAYDAVGAYRTEENGATIDTSGGIALGDADGSFADAGELIGIIADSAQGQQCFATQMFRFANGRDETPVDQCAVDALGEAFVESGGDIRELMVQVALSDAFLYRLRNAEGQ